VPDIVGRLTEFRREHGLSQEMTARVLGVSVATVNRWESRRSVPSSRSVRQVERLLSGRNETASALPVLHRGVPLPADPTPFIGRARELDELLAIWPHQRILNLTGPGGIGKSRLALELLRRSGELPLAIVSFDLVAAPTLALAEISAVLGLRGRAGDHSADVIAEALRNAEGVLFLDTCERVAGGLRELLHTLSVQARGLRVLATSQIPLQAAGEKVWPVPGLQCSPAELQTESTAPGGGETGGTGTRACDAVQFFLARSGAFLPALAAASPDLGKVTRICQLLDGMPLALNLAASRMGTLPLDDLISYWEDYARLLSDPAARHQRQQTIGSAIEWSAALFSRADRDLLCDLSVMVGSFSIGDAAAIRPDLSRGALLEGVSHLVSLSWLAFTTAAGSEPYRILGPLRAWAQHELARSGRGEQAHRRHAEHVRQLCRQAEAEHFRIDRGNWPTRLKRASGNVQAALVWSSTADPELAAEIATALLGWWRPAGRLADGRHWLRACQESGSGLRPPWDARAACAEALLAMDQGDYRESERLAARALPALERAGDARWAGRALIARSSAAKYRGETSAARQHLARAVDHQAAGDDSYELAVALNNLGSLEADAGELGAARRFYERSLQLRRPLGDNRFTAVGLANLADVATLSQSYSEARQLLDEAMRLADRVADDHLRAFVTLNLGENLLGSREYSAAITHFRASRDYAAAAGTGRLHALAVCGLGQALYASGQELDGRDLLRTCEILATRMNDQLVLRKVRDALAEIAAKGRSPRLTARESDVIRLVDDGESDRAIAGHLGITVPTVRRHLENIFAKLGATSRGSAAASWRKLS
jgi:predicted ATPase/DNA-binding CsgD family transcriptional regulator/DNA-binding XRE family transcriptional regulator